MIIIVLIVLIVLIFAIIIINLLLIFELRTHYNYQYIVNHSSNKILLIIQVIKYNQHINSKNN